MGFFTFVRLMMVLFNFLIFLCGLSLMTVGIWVTANGESFLKLLGTNTGQGIQSINVGFFCIAIGAVLLLLGLLGYCGAYRENKCLLLLFFIIILIIFIGEVAAAVVVLVYSATAEAFIKGLASPDLKKNYGTDPVLTKLWDNAMTELTCCGFTNYEDFVGSTFETDQKGLPPICCMSNSKTTPTPTPPTTITCNNDAAQKAAVEGCFKKIVATLKKHANIVGGVAVGIGLLELASMAVSMYLYCHPNNAIG